MKDMERCVEEGEEVMKELEQKCKDIRRILNVINGMGDERNLVGVNGVIEGAGGGE